MTDCSRGWSNATLRLRLLRERTQQRGDAALARASFSSVRSVVIYDEKLEGGRIHPHEHAPANGVAKETVGKGAQKQWPSEWT